MHARKVILGLSTVVLLAPLVFSNYASGYIFADGAEHTFSGTVPSPLFPPLFEDDLFVDLNTTVNIVSPASIAGQVAVGLTLADASVANIFGGTIGSRLDVGNAGTGNIFGGTVEKGVNVCCSDATANIFGGTIGGDAAGSQVQAAGGGTIDIFGGTFSTLANGVNAVSGGSISLFGFEFILDGVALSKSTVLTDQAGTLTGVLADGSSFSFNYAVDDLSTLNVQLIPEPATIFISALGILGMWCLARRRRQLTAV